MSRNELIDIEMTIHFETDMAILASDDGDKDNAVWLPKSQIEVERHRGKSFVTVTLPAWLAEDKFLV